MLLDYLYAQESLVHRDRAVREGVMSLVHTLLLSAEHLVLARQLAGAEIWTALHKSCLAYSVALESAVRCAMV